jgi:Ca-activated chloride channel family protein
MGLNRTAEVADSSGAFFFEKNEKNGDGVVFNTDEFDHIEDNPFARTAQSPLSTYSIDVDTAGYAIARSFIEQGMLPPPSAVRIEELINYFDYDYPLPADGQPFSVNTELAPCPWNPAHLLARIGIRAITFPVNHRPAVNLVFLIDVSGSMDNPNRLPLVQRSLTMLVDALQPTDRIGIVVYAGDSDVVLSPTAVDNKKVILNAIKKLKANGSTAGGAGIQHAYDLAEQYFDPQGVNRVILCTDGDFNVGITNRSDLIDLIKQKAESGVYLTILGFGIGNFRDGTLKQLATKGNGNYGYIDTFNEARKILIEQLEGTLVTVAKDVKIQIEFNPAAVEAYRLIGYENRVLSTEAFNDDTVDAGDIGAGHTVTTFYELILPGELAPVDPLKYSTTTNNADYGDELFTVQIRYKEPQLLSSNLITVPVKAQTVQISPSIDFNFAAGVTAFGMLLRDSPYKGTASFAMVQTMAEQSLGTDPYRYRAEFIRLVNRARTIK